MARMVVWVVATLAVLAGAPVVSPAAAASVSLYSWGFNNNGELGDGTTNSVSSPESITLPEGVSAIHVSAGFVHSLAVGTDGNVYAWGDNYLGKLGDGTENNSLTPEVIMLPHGVHATQVSAGYNHSLAIGADGNVYAWGDNSYGELGDGTNTGSDTPVLISLPGGVHATAVAAGQANYSLAVGSDGNVYAWGDNSFGELGDGTTTSSDTPVLVRLPGGARASSVAAGGGEGFSLAISTDGNVYAWGSNTFGQLGDGSQMAAFAPERIKLPGGVGATAVSAGGGHSLAVGTDGKVYAWGVDYAGQLGDIVADANPNDNDDSSDDDLSPELIPLPGGVGATAVSAGGAHSLAVGTDGNVFAWGENQDGEVGNGTTTEADSPQTIKLAA